MKIKYLFYLLPVVCLSVFVIWWFSDSQIVKRRTNAALDSLHLPAGTSRPERVMQANQARSLLASEITITYPAGTSVFIGAPVKFTEPITLKKDKALTAHSYMTEMMEFMYVEGRDIKSLDITDKTATVRLSFTLRAKSKRGSEQSKLLDGTFTFTKNDGDWLLAAASFPN